MIRNIKNIFNFIKVRNILKQIYKETNLIESFSKTFNNQFKIDYAGRIYTIITPKDLDINLIYSYDNSSMNPNEHFKKMIMDRLIICESYMKDTDIFDLLSFDIKIIDKENNIYILIFKPYNFDEFNKSLKYFWKIMKILGVLVILTIITIKFL